MVVINYVGLHASTFDTFKNKTRKIAESWLFFDEAATFRNKRRPTSVILLGIALGVADFSCTFLRFFTDKTTYHAN